jgi:ADP-ribosyl-[dinitrogen reductase] hydrolase
MPLSILLRTAQGDAYGAGFEYGTPEHVRTNNTLIGFVKNTKHDLTPSCYTDDAQMSIANTEVIVSGERVTRKALAESYFRCFKRDQRLGYAGGFYNLLCEVQSADELLTRLGPAASDKSGGAMRAVVFGIYPDIHRVKQLARLQAAITHNTQDGINAAMAAALMGHYFLYDLGPKRRLGKFLERNVKGRYCDWDTPWRKEVGSKGWQSVHAAVTAVVEHDSLASILKACVAYSGDVDTVAAVALGAASASREVSDDLPEFLFEDLENEAYGRDYIMALDVKLEARMRELAGAPAEQYE